MIMFGLLICMSLCICLYMFTLSKALLVSNPTATMCFGGLGMLKSWYFPVIAPPSIASIFFGETNLESPLQH